MQTRSEPVRADRVAREHRAIRLPNFVDRSLHRQNSWPDGVLSMDSRFEASHFCRKTPLFYHKTPVFDRFLSFDIKLRTAADSRH